jgi:uncharacterized protein (TIGR02301 family)
MMISLRLTKLFLALMLSALLGTHSIAQTIVTQDPPYHAKLLRLSEVLGSVHFLRNLCGEAGTSWRDKMGELIDSEKPLPARKAQLTASFNHGYRAFDSVYVRCNGSAIEALNGYMKEGAALSQEIASRYGN